MIKDIIKQSRSYRRFDGNVKITRDTLQSLVDLARFSPSMRNQQALKFLLSCDKKTNNLIFPTLAWAGALKDWPGPGDGERPSAYIVVVGDTKISRDFGPDYGIVAQSILLGATEMGLGGCMIGSIKKDALKKSLLLDERFQILLVIALGKPNERIVLEDIKEGNVRYYRDKDSCHHVPKRTLKELII